MYQVVHTVGESLPRDGKFLPLGGVHQLLSDAMEDRKLSGDLIIVAETREIVQDQCWLFPWEKLDHECYVRRMMRKDSAFSTETNQ